MSEKENKQLTRRDALKVLGAAAGATALANLPNKWHSPELLSGVLPVHAQTSVCYSIILEVLSTDGAANGNSDPWPDELNWNTGPGSYARFYCQEGCATIWLFLNEGTTATYKVTTISHEFNIVVNGEETRYILINMGTGEYGLDFETTPSGCEWSEIPEDAPRSNQSRPSFGQ